MKKIICAGECALDIIFDGGKPVGSMPGGRIANAAAILARAGLPVSLAGEISADKVGDILADFLTEAGVDMTSVDRFTEGRTPLNIFTTESQGLSDVTRYEQYPDKCFDIIWPRIDENDIVVYGGFYALDARMRPGLSQLLDYAAERKAVTVYLPVFLPQQEPRITRVMPAILENLESADVVVARNNDLKLIFGVDEGERCYHDHIDFYCRSMINIDTACQRICYYSGREVTEVGVPASTCQSMMWNAGAVAGVVAALYAADEAKTRVAAPDDDFRRKVISEAARLAVDASATLVHDWQKQH